MVQCVFNNFVGCGFQLRSNGFQDYPVLSAFYVQSCDATLIEASVPKQRRIIKGKKQNLLLTENQQFSRFNNSACLLYTLKS